MSDLGAALGIIGSIASIIAIPLSVWLYLRSEEGKVENARREIVRILGGQLGRPRPLTLFEVNAVVSSELRSRGLKPDEIDAQSILDDLVKVALSNPMLAEDQRGEIVAELQRAPLPSGLRERIVARRLDKDGGAKLLPSGEEHVPDSQMVNLSMHLELSDFHDSLRYRHSLDQAHRQAITSARFGIVAALTCGVAVFILLRFGTLDWFKSSVAVNGQSPLQGFVFGALAALLAWVVVGLPGLLASSRLRRARRLQDV